MCLPAHLDQSSQDTFEQKGVIRTSMVLCSARSSAKPNSSAIGGGRPNVLGRESGGHCILGQPLGPPHTKLRSLVHPLSSMAIPGTPSQPASPEGQCFSTGNVCKCWITTTDGSCSQVHQTVLHKEKPSCLRGQYSCH